MAAKFGVRTTSFPSSGANTFSPYKCRDQVKVWDLNVESDPHWILKNIVNDCLYQSNEDSLRRIIVEIKTYEDEFTGQMLNN